MEANHVSIIAVGLLALGAAIATASDMYRPFDTEHRAGVPAVAGRIPASYLPVYADRLPFEGDRPELREPGEPYPEVED